MAQFNNKQGGSRLGYVALGCLFFVFLTAAEKREEPPLGIQEKEHSAIIIEDVRQESEQKNSSFLDQWTLSQEDLEFSSGQTLDQFLNQNSELQIQSVRGTKQKDLYFRGLGGKYLQILVDGSPVVRDEEDRPEFSLLNLDDIEKVTLEKGAFSSLNGNQFFSGTLNLTTRKNKKTGVLVKISETQEMSSLFSNRSGHWRQPESLFIQGQWLVNENLNHQATFETIDRPALDRDKGPKSLYAQDRESVEQKKVQWKSRWENKEHLVDLKLFWNQQETSKQNSLLSPSSGYIPSKDESQSTLWGIGAQYHYSLSSQMVIENQLDYTKMVESLSLGYNSLSQDDHLKQDLQTEMIHARSAFKNLNLGSHLLSFGFEHETQKVNQEFISGGGGEVSTYGMGNRQLSQWHLFGEDQIPLPGQGEWILGSRLSAHNQFSSTLNLSSSFLWPFSLSENYQGQTGFSFGTGTRYPSVSELYYLLDHTSIGNYRVLGNENLNPERSLQSQGSFGFKSPWVDMNIVPSAGIIRDYILYERKSDSLGSILYKSTNASQVTFLGLSWDVLTRLAPDLSFSTQWYYTDAFHSTTGQDLPLSPKNTVHLGLQYQFNSNFQLQWQNKWTDSSWIDDSHQDQTPSFWDSSISVRYEWKPHWIFNVQWLNVFDEKRPLAIDNGPLFQSDFRPILGRSLLLHVSWSWDLPKQGGHP